MTSAKSTLPRVAGLGTALPQHRMTQDEATELAQRICCQNESQRALVRVLYRRAGVKQRFTTVPYQIAYEWFDAPIDVEAEAGADDSLAALASENGARAGRPKDSAVLVDEAPPRPLGPTTAERMELYRAGAPPLALAASAKALVAAGCDPAEITHLVTVSCTGFFAPGIDLSLIEGLGLARTVERIHVGFMGCHGALNGLKAADAIVRAHPASRVLLCAVELCSLHFCFEWDPARVVGNAVFADGAAALVIDAGESSGPPAPGQAAASRQAAGARPWRLAATGSCLIPDSADGMSWRIGDHGFEMFLAASVPELIKEHLRAWLVGWLAEQQLTIEDVGSWAVHPGGPRILTAVEEALDLPRSGTATSRAILAECGNMSSPTVLFIIERLQAAGGARPCVALGFGPGLAAEAALFV